MYTFKPFKTFLYEITMRLTQNLKIKKYATGVMALV